MRYPSDSAKPKARRHMSFRRIIPLFLVTLILGSACGYTFLAISKPAGVIHASQTSYTSATPKQSDLPWPSTGQASIGSLEDGLLASSGRQTPVPIASTAKVITALAVLDKKPFSLDSRGETITLTSVDVDLYNHYVAVNGSSVAVENGEQLSEYQALEALMLPSANNMADSLVIWAFGSTDAYVTYAQSMLKNLGAKDTTVSDPSGFSSNTTSTARDLVIIGRKALQNPVLKQIVAEKEADIPVAGTIRNVNQLLGTKGIIGIKTGNTDEAGGCLIFAATRNLNSSQAVTIIGAVMGSSNLYDAFDDSLTLLEAAEANFGQVTVIPANTKVSTYKTDWGTLADIYTKQPLTIIGWVGKSYPFTMSINDVAAPLAAGSTVGTVYVKTGDQLSPTPVVIKSPLTGPSITWRLRHYF